MKYKLEIFNKETQEKIAEVFYNSRASLGGGIKMAHAICNCQIKQTMYSDKSTVYVNGIEFGTFPNEEAEHVGNVLRSFETKAVINVLPQVEYCKYV